MKVSCKDCIKETVCRYNDGVNLWCRGDCPEFINKGNILNVPCKVGDKVYVADADYETVLTMEIESITIEEDGILLTIWNDEEMCSWSCFVDEMALDDVYFTIDEAEKAQERLKGND